MWSNPLWRPDAAADAGVTANLDAGVDGSKTVGLGFQAAATFAVGSNPLFVALGDLNADGKLDIVAANSKSDNVSILLGTGMGSLAGSDHVGRGKPADVSGAGRPER